MLVSVCNGGWIGEMWSWGGERDWLEKLAQNSGEKGPQDD